MLLGGAGDDVRFRTFTALGAVRRTDRLRVDVGRPESSTAVSGSGLQDPHLVTADVGVARDESEFLDLGLGDEHPVERIGVVRR